MVKKIDFNLSSSDLSALLCSRICHDIISPIGAINNGLELLDEEGLEDDAMELIRSSAANATARLKFARIAFGASGSINAPFELSEAEEVIKDFSAIDNKIALSWTREKITLPKQKIKLLLNLFMIAYVSLPRGGNLEILVKTSIDEECFFLNIRGSLVRLPEKFIRILSGEMDFQITAHDVQFYYTALLACESDMALSYRFIDDQNLVLIACKCTEDRDKLDNM
ncbi:histidine phosphotransferase ChpT [Candidatus Liberibacter sp.]|uniref:histidine phosphotransferase ChpT n=1 Tax=Candidatus Liberibacter sp. TaxID=34022 RepID=UPI0015F5A933|nr:histidine phosphotransferase family protein [Candidatus Liberibacter sp.]MBA5724559.1 histidine phosphotransferase [Candidatus Liberibacter sp.]